VPATLCIAVPFVIVIAGQTTVTLRVMEPEQPFASVAVMVKLTDAALEVGVPWSWPLELMLSQAGAPVSV
jgi:hypothetical protein